MDPFFTTTTPFIEFNIQFQSQLTMTNDKIQISFIVQNGIFLTWQNIEVNCIGCWKHPLVRCTNCRRTNIHETFKEPSGSLTCKRCGTNFSAYTHYCAKNSIFSEASTNTIFSKKTYLDLGGCFYIVIFIIFLLSTENI